MALTDPGVHLFYGLIASVVVGLPVVVVAFDRPVISDLAVHALSEYVRVRLC